MSERTTPPGLVRRLRKDGTVRMYWCAKNASRRAKNYPDGHVKIPDDATQDQIADICGRNYDRLQQWLNLREIVMKNIGALNMKEYDSTFVNASNVPELADIKAEGRAGYVYFIGDARHVKIGFTSQPKKRMMELQISAPNAVRHYLLIIGAESHETALHALFYRDHHRGEWYKITKRVKCFMEKHRANQPAEYIENMIFEKVRTRSCQSVRDKEKTQ